MSLMEALVLIAAVIVVLPFVLQRLGSGRDRSDSRGRRVNRTWYVRH